MELEIVVFDIKHGNREAPTLYRERIFSIKNHKKIFFKKKLHTTA